MAYKESNRVSSRYGSYNGTSNAYKYPEYTPDYQKKKRIVKKKKLRIYTRIKDRGVRITKEAVITFITVFIGCTCLIMVNAMISDKKSSISSIRSEVKQQKELNHNLVAEISKDFDEVEIERLASTMRIGKPKSYQIITFNAPKENYELTGTFEEVQEEMDTTSWINEATGYLGKLLKKGSD